jgi:hypothetical protein
MASSDRKSHNGFRTMLEQNIPIARKIHQNNYRLKAIPKSKLKQGKANTVSPGSNSNCMISIPNILDQGNMGMIE